MKIPKDLYKEWYRYNYTSYNTYTLYTIFRGFGATTKQRSTKSLVICCGSSHFAAFHIYLALNWGKQISVTSHRIQRHWRPRRAGCWCFVGSSWLSQKGHAPVGLVNHENLSRIPMVVAYAQFYSDYIPRTYPLCEKQNLKEDPHRLNGRYICHGQ